jgi:hypothetical protein
MASTNSNPGAARSVTVALPSHGLDNLDKVNKIVANTLGKAGCPRCFSGFDIRFTHDWVVNPQTLEVGPIG